ncbi:MAG: hypothetical protein AAGG68_02210 [Bacteroidota bacterium]
MKFTFLFLLLLVIQIHLVCAQKKACTICEIQYDSSLNIEDHTFKETRFFLSELGILKGISNSTIIYDDPLYTGMKIELSFGDNGLLISKKSMKKGWIKYNNSWAGSWNSLTKYFYNTNNCVESIEEFWSHTRFFKTLRKRQIFKYVEDIVVITTHTYNEKGRLIHTKEYKTSYN